MDKWTNALYLSAVIILAIYLIYKDEIETFMTRDKVCNKLDNRCYEVVEKFEDSQSASEILAQLNKFCLRLMRHLREKYIWNYNSNQEAVDLVSYLLSNYNPDGIIENAPTSDVNTSYVDDKGRVFAICLREKKSGHNKFHSIHDLQFVVMHEMAHMANVKYGHNTDFWEIFKFLMNEAHEAKLHDPVDYGKKPMNYCSLEVNHNPFFDADLRVI